MEKRVFNEEFKAQVVKDYEQNKTVRDIIAKHDINTYQLYDILSEKGIPKRYPSKSIKHEGYPSKLGKKTFTCPHCKRSLPVVKGGCFCTYCGGDIRDKKDVALSNLNKLYLFVKEQPDAVNLIRAISEYIKGVK